MSKSLSAHEIKWHTYDKEAYAIAYALFKFEHLLSDVHFTLRTDHKNLTFLKVSRSQRVQRWRLEVHQFDFHVEHIPGKDNVIADEFSRLIDLDDEQINALIEIQST